MHSTVPIKLSVFEAFFLETMAHGYAAGKEPQRDTPLPGWKTLDLLHPTLPIRLVDQWHTTPSSMYSTGVTTMYYTESEVIAWVMHYGGWYHKLAIPILRQSLKVSYQSGKFNGGRGPDQLEGSDYAYLNHPVLGSTFARFSGVEYVRRKPGRVLYGTHQYFGYWCATTE
jgi:hypothetical protein